MRPSLAASRFRRAIRIGVTLLSIIVLLVTAVLFAFWLGRKELKKQVQAELSALEARNIFCSLAEVQASYQTPNPDVTPLYLEAFSKLKSPELKSVELVQLFDSNRPLAFPPVDAEVLSALSEAENENEDFILTLRQANKIMEARYPVDLTQGMAALMKHLRDIGESTKLLRALGWCAVNTDRNDAAMAYALDILWMSQSLEEEPALISQLVRGNCLHMAGSLLEEVFSNGRPEPAALDRLQRFLEGFEMRTAMSRALAYERCILIDVLTGPFEKKWEFINYDQSAQGADAITARLGLLKIELQGIHERDLLIALGLLGKIDHAIAGQDTMTELDQVETELAGHKVVHKGSVPPIIPAMLLPVTVKGVKRLTETEAMKSVLLATVAIQRYQLANGRPPENLKRLVPDYLPAMPIDPFNSKPLIYQVTSEGYQLYSIGMDRQDNGGHRFSGGKDQAYDLVVDVRSAQ